MEKTRKSRVGSLSDFNSSCFNWSDFHFDFWVTNAVSIYNYHTHLMILIQRSEAMEKMGGALVVNMNGDPVVCITPIFPMWSAVDEDVPEPYLGFSLFAHFAQS